MNFKEYVERARETAIYPDRGKIGGLLYAAIGLGGEAGEMLNKVKKILRDNDGTISSETTLSISGELGDILWYIVAMCDELSLNIEDVAMWNLIKLSKRKEMNMLKGSGDNREIVLARDRIGKDLKVFFDSTPLVTKEDEMQRIMDELVCICKSDRRGPNCPLHIGDTL